MKLAVAACLLVLALAPDARAGAFAASDPLASATNGIVLGPDGNLWVAEETAGSVAKVSPNGTYLDRIYVGGAVSSLANGPDHRIWATVTSADKLVSFDALAAAPVVTDVPVTSNPGKCGPVALAHGGDRVYFSTPQAAGCTVDSTLHYAQGGMIFPIGEYGDVYDLAFVGGKLYAPDYTGGFTRRFEPGISTVFPDGMVTTPGGPYGVAVTSDGTVYTTLYDTGKVARYPGSLPEGDAEILEPTVPLNHPAGVLAVGDGAYVVGRDSANIVAVDAAGAFTAFPGATGQPFDIVAGTDGDYWLTDSDRAQITRFVHGAPRATALTATPTGATSADLAATVDTRGLPTQFSFTAGTVATTAVELPASAGGPKAAKGSLSGLEPATTYTVTARAVNALGEAVTEAATFTTPANPGPPPETALAARTLVKAKVRKRRTRIASLTVASLFGGETIALTCKGRGCPLKRQTLTEVAPGTTALTPFFAGARLRPRTRITVVVSRGAAKPVTTVLTMRKKRKPKVSRS